MAGAGGILVILLGIVLGALAGLAAILLLAFGFPRMRREGVRLAAWFVATLAALAILMTLPAWIVILTGRDTRGEAFDRGEIDLWIYALLLVAPVTLVVMARRAIVSGRRA